MVAKKIRIPEAGEATLKLGARSVKLTNLGKIFWKRGRKTPPITKRDLLQYYADVAPYLLPHLKGRPMVMKRYPNGADGEFFFMKRAPSPRPPWVKTCSVAHASGSVIDFPVVDDIPTLLWLVNLGCIDMNPWYGRCRAGTECHAHPDFLHFDLDPVEGTPFSAVREAALAVREGLESLGMKPYAKTTGATGIHVTVPIRTGPKQKEVWTFAKKFAFAITQRHPKLLTVEYRIADRPKRHVLVDYNQNAWGKTLASIYSVRPVKDACVSMPVSWREIEGGVVPEDYRLDNVPALLKKSGDKWKALLEAKGRFKLEVQ